MNKSEIEKLCSSEVPSFEKKVFSYFDEPIEALSNNDLIAWYLGFKTGADPNNPRDQQDHEEFMSELPNRDEEFKSKIDFIDSVL